MKKRVAILGSTGSIGAQTLDVIARLGDRMEVAALSAHGRVERLLSQARTFGVTHLCLTDSSAVERARRLAPGVRFRHGVEGLCELAALPEVDLVVMAVAGAVGIRPTHAALSAGKAVALASKEVLVAAGEHTMRLSREHGGRILPIDSEHSAIFQCLQGAPEKSIDRIFLTASGGPFRTATMEQMRAATPEQALKHPTWNMGGLVTINSATLMNKGLEIIEAHWLFGVPPDSVEVVIHPQSIVHSLVRFTDGSVLAQLGQPDMRLPIQYALTYPERPATGLPTIEPAGLGQLTFEPPDETRFPALRIAREAIAAGGTMPAVMNAANEAAVELFLQRERAFFGIMDTVESVMKLHTPAEATYENVLAADAWARSAARACQV